MRVQEVATQVGMTPHTIRYYHKLGLLSPNRDPFNDYRRFDSDALERLRFVKRAKTLGFSLAEIREIVGMSHARKSPCPRVRDIVRTRIAENAAHIAEMIQLQQRLEHTSHRWSAMPDRAPSGRAICHLIESLGAEED